MVWYAMVLVIALLSAELRCMGFVLGGRECSVPPGCTGWRHSRTQHNLFGGGKKGEKKPGMGNMLDRQVHCSGVPVTCIRIYGYFCHGAQGIIIIPLRCTLWGRL